MMEEKFKWRVTNSWLRCFYRRVPRGVPIQMQLLCLWTCHTIHTMFLFWVDFSFPTSLSVPCRQFKISSRFFFFFFPISQPLVSAVRVIEKSHSTCNSMWPLALTGWSRRDHLSVWYMIMLYGPILLYDVLRFYGLKMHNALWMHPRLPLFKELVAM